MFFAPDCTFMLSEDGTKIKYLRAGLGCSQNGYPYYAENDKTLPVDIDISIEDQMWINELRNAMSKLVHQRINLNDAIVICDDIKKLFMKILFRKREQISRPEEFVGNQLEDEEWPFNNQLIKAHDELDGTGIFKTFDYIVPRMKTLKCPICLEENLLKDPQSTICGLVFCKECLEKSSIVQFVSVA